MKKILSIFAFVAMLCIPFSLVSCGDDDDPSTSNTQYAIFTISSSVSGNTETLPEVINLIQSKMGNEAKIEPAISGTYTIKTSSQSKGESLIKAIKNYENEIDQIVINHDNLFFYLTFKSGATEVYKYSYKKNTSKDDQGDDLDNNQKDDQGDDLDDELDNAEPITYGTYTYTDASGAVWSFTYTDKDAGNGYQVGSLVLPTDTIGAKAGTYEGKCMKYSLYVTFESNQMQGKVTGDLPVISARFGVLTSAGAPTLVRVNSTQLFSKELFQKVK